MAKKYVLLKDLPDCQAGFFYTQTDDKEFYVCYENLGKWSVAYKKKYVENNPSWFKEVVEKCGLIGDYERIDLLTELRDAIKKFKASKQANTTKEEKPHIVKFRTKKISDKWYCYGTIHGYDHSFCSDNEYHSVELAKRIMDKIGYLSECEFPETLKTF